MLRTGATIGILGGGQLARMLALAAARLGLRCHVYAPDERSCAFDVVHAKTCASYQDEVALGRFAGSVDVITYEFENVPAATAAFLAKRKPVLPDPKVLEITQDRLIEKEFIAGLKIATAPYAAVHSAVQLADAVEMIGLPAVLKTRRLGYDGKGQARISAVQLADAVEMIGLPAVLKTRRLGYDGKGQARIAKGTDPMAAWRTVQTQPCIMEGFIKFEREISVVAARAADGKVECFEATENEHRDHILHISRAPARVTPAVAAEARRVATRIAKAFDYVGVLAVEMFVVRKGGRRHVLVNEIAPRVHNSGHWTIDGATVSQFEQHIRAVAGMPLAKSVRLGRKVEMVNLIGTEIDEATRWLSVPGASVHVYHKGEARPRRKMGHVTRVWR
ncbi:MAG: 5-(carboxyamino)imidazole ribonucleotide synthase [Pseudolabrys sp.]